MRCNSTRLEGEAAFGDGQPLGAGKRWGRELRDPGAGEVRGCDEASRARPGLGCLFLVVAVLALGLSQAEAAYRLTFRKGTSIEVQSYEELGDAIWYQRCGRTVVVPKANLSAVEEAVRLPLSAPPTPAPRAPSTAPPNVTQGFQETSRPPLNPPAASPPPGGCDRNGAGRPLRPARPGAFPTNEAVRANVSPAG
jgi:hypothetical protein